MKTLNDFINGNVPPEVALGVVAGAGVLLVVAWYFLTRADTPRRTVGLGPVLIALGAAGAAFFLFVFDVSVPFNGGRLANLDLLSQRQNGIIVSSVVALIGAIWMAFRPECRK